MQWPVSSSLVVSEQSLVQGQYMEPHTQVLHLVRVACMGKDPAVIVRVESLPEAVLHTRYASVSD